MPSWKWRSKNLHIKTGILGSIGVKMPANGIDDPGDPPRAERLLVPLKAMCSRR